MTDERHLITRVLDGHAEDFGYFLDRYGQEVMALVARLVPQADAEEIVQDAFVSAYQHLGDFLGRSSFSTWVCSIAYRHALSWLRRQKAKAVSVDEDERLLKTLSDEAVDEALAAVREERIAHLEQAIDLLKPDEKTIVMSYYYDNRPLADIAEILGTSASTLAVRLHRIRHRLYLIINRMEHGA